MLPDGCPQVVLAIHIAHSAHKNAAASSEAFYCVVKHPAQIIVAGKAIHNAVEHHKIKLFI